MKIYAIIVTYNGSKWIDKCFSSLNNSKIPLKILAIDNASTDRTPEIIKKNYPHVEVIETGKNLGFGKANNIGLKRVLDDKAAYAFLLNQDAWIEPDTVEKLVNLAEANTTAGIISPIHLNGNGNNFDIGFLNYSSNTPEGRKFYFNCFFNNNLENSIRTNFINAACWLIPIKCIQNVGGFNPVFPHYGEDFEYFRRIKEAGYDGIISTKTFVYHDRDYDRPKSNQKETIFSYIHNYLLIVSNPKTNLLYHTIIHIQTKLFELIWAIGTFNKTLRKSNVLYILLIIRNLKLVKSTRQQLKHKTKASFL